MVLSARAATLVNWNVEWATPRSWRSPEILNRIEQHKPDIICLTETHVGLLSGGGHVITSRADYGYKVREERRKVLLWSREPWEQVDERRDAAGRLGSDVMPPGRFVSGVTRTSLGEVTVIGVCIPWADSRVRGTTVKRKRWEDHRQYLNGLSEVLDRTSLERLIVVGDFNQRIQQGGRVPKDVQMALQSAVASRMTIATAGLGFRGRKSIDHVALGNDLTAEYLGVISNLDGERRLSDHFGVVAGISARVT